MTDLRSAQLLDVAVATLRAEILPSITDEVARIKVDHVTRMMWAVSARLTKREAALREFLDAASALTNVPPPPADADPESVEKAFRDAEERICARLPALLSAKDGERLRQLVEIERRLYMAQDPDIANGSAVVYRGGRIDADNRGATASRSAPITPESLTLYLRNKKGRNGVSATNVKAIPGGFSKDTIFFSLDDGTEQKLVMRKDLEIPLLEKSVVNEYRLLQGLFEHGFPVAEPVWLESDASVFGGAFLVSRRVEGTSDVRRWASDAAGARAACLEFAKIIARLHTFSPSQLGFSASDAALSAGECMKREVARWIDLFRRNRLEPFPLQELALAWLADNIPPVLFERPARVIHGDLGFHNLMCNENGAVTALLDWEFAGLGDPTQDLCFVRQFTDSIMPWTEFLSAYREAGGEAPCREAEFFYHLWTKARNAVCCIHSQTLFDTAMPTEMRFALSGHIFAPYMFIDEGDTLVSHLVEAKK